MPATSLVLPNFLIVGMMKAGTRTLTTYLRQHPEVFMVRKEINFFGRDDRWGQGPEWYARHFAERSDERMIGEKTPGYAYRPHVPERIAETLPDVRLLWCFRNPVDRAYSHYWHFRRKGREDLPFEKAFDRLGPATSPSAYREQGHYAEHLDRYLAVFPIRRMCFVVLEDVKRDAGAVAERVYRFLEVDPTFVPKNIGQVMHRGWTMRNRHVHRVVERVIDGRGGPLTRRLRRLTRSRGYPPMAPETRERLLRYYRPHVETLAARTGLDLECWNS